MNYHTHVYRVGNSQTHGKDYNSPFWAGKYARTLENPDITMMAKYSPGDIRPFRRLYVNGTPHCCDGTSKEVRRCKICESITKGIADAAGEMKPLAA